MERWEYFTLGIFKDDLKDAKGKKYRNWVARFSDGSQIEGLNEILNRVGKAGWELVSLAVEFSYPVTNAGGGADTQSYRAIFKRKLVDPTS